MSEYFTCNSHMSMYVISDNLDPIPTVNIEHTWANGRFLCEINI